jgi:hypothetical protein
MATREDLGVFVPGTVENPTAACSAHASHALEPRGEKVELEIERRPAHRLFPAGVELLEPGIVLVHTLQSMLETESLGERSCQRALARANHPGDSDEHPEK